MFQTYDPYILVRDNATRWEKKIVLPPPQIKEYVPISYSSKNEQDKDRRIIEKIIATGFSNISETTGGFPPLRQLAFVIGGYVGQGYISKYDVLTLFEYHIDQHPYLGQKSDTYKTTASKTIESGIQKPVALC